MIPFVVLIINHMLCLLFAVVACFCHWHVVLLDKNCLTLFDKLLRDFNVYIVFFRWISSNDGPRKDQQNCPMVGAFDSNRWSLTLSLNSSELWLSVHFAEFQEVPLFWSVPLLLKQVSLDNYTFQNSIIPLVSIHLKSHILVKLPQKNTLRRQSIRSMQADVNEMIAKEWEYITY